MNEDQEDSTLRIAIVDDAEFFNTDINQEIPNLIQEKSNDMFRREKSFIMEKKTASLVSNLKKTISTMNVA
jgi:plasmid replication initiation protein